VTASREGGANAWIGALAIGWWDVGWYAVGAGVGLAKSGVGAWTGVVSCGVSLAPHRMQNMPAPLTGAPQWGQFIARSFLESG
jgi:hypothetical protein